MKISIFFIPMYMLALYLLTYEYSHSKIHKEPKLECSIYMTIINADNGGIYIVFCAKGSCTLDEVQFKNSLSNIELSYPFTMHIEDYQTFMECNSIVIDEIEKIELFKSFINEIVLFVTTQSPKQTFIFPIQVDSLLLQHQSEIGSTDLQNVLLKTFCVNE